MDPGVSDAAEAALFAQARARGASPAECVTELALVKLLAGVRQAEPGQPVLAADTIVALEGPDGLELGKPTDRAAAAEMLRALSGTTHVVCTGVASVDEGGRLQRGVATTTVRFRPYDEATLQTFLDAEVWQGKAGAYGVQDPASAPLIEGVEGSRSNVIGLPLELVREHLPACFPRD